jgi:hypothetical protein
MHYTLYIISLFTKTLKSPTCFGPKDHPQGARPVPSWLLKFKISRKTLVKNYTDRAAAAGRRS